MDWILLAIVSLLGFMLVMYRLQQTGKLPDFLGVHPPMILVHSEKGKPTIDYLATRFERFWRIWGVLGVIVTGLGLLLGTVLVIFSAISLIRNPESAALASDPKNLLVLPGVNDYLPLEAAPAIILALLIGMVVHEFGHAVLCRVGDIEVKSTGLVFLSFIPAGAFVEPDEESQEAATRWSRIRMFSGGIMNNLAVTVIGLVIFVVLMGAIVPAAGGAVGGVIAGSPAADSGLEQGDRIVAVEGVTTDSNAAVIEQFQTSPETTLHVTTAAGEQHVMTRELFVQAAPSVESDLETGDRIVAVNGHQVTTQAEFTDVLRSVSSQTVTIETAAGETVTHPVGARVVLEEGTELGTAFSDTPRVVITHIDDTRIRSAADLQTVLESYDAEATVSVTAAPVSDPMNTREVELTVQTPTDAAAALNVQPTAGIAGIELADTGVVFYPTSQYLGLLGGSSGETPNLGVVLFLILLFPFGTVSGLPFNFAGFTPSVTNFITVTGPFAGAPEVVFFAASVLFWTVWLNLNLALFNAIPTVALDGGKYLAIAIESGVNKLGLPNPKQTSAFLTRAAVYTMLGFVLVMMFYPALAQYLGF